MILHDRSKTSLPGLKELKEHKFDGKHILVVDDNDLNREISEELLKMTGADIISVCDGLQAVEKVLACGAGFFSLILMDIYMPVMDGYEAAKKIRAINEPYYLEVPIIAFSANTAPEDRKNSFESGMNEFMAKPIDIDHLNILLKKWVR